MLIRTRHIGHLCIPDFRGSWFNKTSVFVDTVFPMISTIELVWSYVPTVGETFYDSSGLSHIVGSYYIVLKVPWGTILTLSPPLPQKEVGNSRPGSPWATLSPHTLPVCGNKAKQWWIEHSVLFERLELS